MNRSLALAVFLSLAAATSLFAQFGPVEKPFFMEKEDFTLLAGPDGPPASFNITTPPPFPVRAMAEWEESQALLIAWTSYPNILAEIVRAAKDEVNVIILCANASSVASCKNTLTSKGVDFSTNVTFLTGKFNSIWSRDYGPNNVYQNGVDSLLFVDWRYNRPSRPDDDKVPELLAPSLGVPVYSTIDDPTALVNTGGNFMSDGMGTAFASKLILDENDANNSYGYQQKSEADINAIFHDFMGIDRYIKMDELPYDGIHHIDMHMKLLDEETLLVSEYPAGKADGPQIEANLQYVLDNWKTPFGEKYRVVRIPAPPDAQGQFPDNPNGDYRTYSNATFVNRTVLLPTYQEKYDTTAIRIWKENAPGYKIVGIQCNDIITNLGAIHCITHEIGAAEPIVINHHRPTDCSIAITDNVPYPVGAKIRTRSGVQSATLYFTNKPSSDITTWQTLPMTSVGIDSFSAEIPPFTALPGDTLVYYIEARANSGKKMRRPITAPTGFYKANFCTASATGEVVAATMEAVFPNPASAITCIPVVSGRKSRAQIDLLDMNGRLVESIFSGEMAAGDSKYFFNAAGLSSGVYVVRLRTEEAVAAQRVVVK